MTGRRFRALLIFCLFGTSPALGDSDFGHIETDFPSEGESAQEAERGKEATPALRLGVARPTIAIPGTATVFERVHRTLRALPRFRGVATRREKRSGETPWQTAGRRVARGALKINGIEYNPVAHIVVGSVWITRKDRSPELVTYLGRKGPVLSPIIAPDKEMIPTGAAPGTFTVDGKEFFFQPATNSWVTGAIKKGGTYSAKLTAIDLPGSTESSDLVSVQYGRVTDASSREVPRITYSESAQGKEKMDDISYAVNPGPNANRVRVGSVTFQKGEADGKAGSFYTDTLHVDGKYTVRSNEGWSAATLLQFKGSDLINAGIERGAEGKYKDGKVLPHATYVASLPEGWDAAKGLQFFEAWDYLKRAKKALNEFAGELEMLSDLGDAISNLEKALGRKEDGSFDSTSIKFDDLKKNRDALDQVVQKFEESANDPGPPAPTPSP